MLNQSTQLDSLFRALADPGRRTIVERLSRGPASVSELAEPMDMSLSAVVQHLQFLENTGLIRSEKVGRVRTCQLEVEALDTAGSWIAEQKRLWDQRLDRLGRHLNSQATSKPPQRKRKKEK